MLVLPRDELAVTDTADYAIEAIANAGIEEVVVLGRRGPAQAAFTTPELRELGELTQADVIVDPAEAELDPGSAAWLEQAHATNKKNVEVIQGYAQRTPSRASPSASCSVSCARRSRSTATQTASPRSWSPATS